MSAREATLGPLKAAEEASVGHQGYPYEPLPLGRYIRYLLLEPGEPDDPIACKLHTARLDEAHFEALSYVWGTPSMTERISCNETSIYVTVNLRDALVQARHRFEPRALWVDSICINQEDREEKGLQVALMAEIYSKSSCTVICLGGNDAEAHALPAAGLLADVNAMMDRVLQQKGFSWKPDSFPVPDPDEPLLSDMRWESVAILTGQPWFRRGWVVQEAALGPDARILWGDVDIDWLHFLRAYSWVHSRAITIHFRVFGDRSISWLHLMAFDLRRKQETITIRAPGHDPSLTMLQVLDCARVLSMTDARDRIYACLGLPNSTPRPPEMIPNYGKTYLEVYREFACEYLLSTDMDLDILLLTQHDERTLADTEFGSWIPRWHLYYSASLFRNNIRPVAPLSPGASSGARRPSLVDQNTLKVQGVRIGTVRFVSQLSFHSSTDIETVRRVWQDATLINSGSNEESGYNSQASTLEATIQTLTAGNYRGSLEDWAEKESAYAQILQAKDGTKSDVPADVSEVHDTLLYTAHNRKLIVTDRGHYGLAPLTTCAGDAVYVIIGAKTVFILRETERDHHYRFVGDSYVMSKGVPGDDHRLKPLGNTAKFDDWVSWGLEEEDTYRGEGGFLNRPRNSITN
ncbi:hypothetical protein diail_672 [Diaporthe ilicicola]|nr:hypothetical protein diail_672 [Diaporthe ilicicola]